MKKYKAVISFTLAAVLAAGLCGCSDGGKAQTSAEDNKYSLGNASIEDKVESVSIDWADGDIEFVLHDGNTVDISEEFSSEAGEDMQMRWKLDGTTLCIKYGEPGFTLVSAGGPEKHLTVALPEKLVLDELVIDAASTDIKGQDMKAGAVEADITSGSLDMSLSADKLDIEATSGTVKTVCEAKDIRITSTSGSIYLTQKGAADSIYFDVTSGDIEAELEKFGNLDISGTSSDVKLILPEKADFTAKVDTTSGKFKSDIPVKMEKDAYVAGNGSSKINVSVTSGDVNILAK